MNRDWKEILKSICMKTAESGLGFDSEEARL